MGTLHYDGDSFPIDDRLLAHLQLIFTLKLRRKEGFFISWTIDSSRGGGQDCIWMDNGVPVRFHYQGNRRPLINKEWAEKLNLAANTSAGLVIGRNSIESDDGLPV